MLDYVQFRQDVLKPFFGHIKSGESFFVVGAPSMGKTRLMDFLLGDDPDMLRTGAAYDRELVKKHYLGPDLAAQTWIVRVDMNRLPREGDWVFRFFELMLHTVLLACDKCELADDADGKNNGLTREQLEEIKLELAKLDSRVIESKDPLMAHRLFEMAVNMLCRTHKLKLRFLFDEFDETYRVNMPREVFAQLRAIRDSNKYLVSYVLFLRVQPETLRSPKENEEFYELISRNMLGLTPYSMQDTFYIIGQLEKRREFELSQEQREWLCMVSGGHPGLIQALFTILKENPTFSSKMQNLDWLVVQESVREEFRKIYNGLLENEKMALVEFARGNPSAILPEIGKLLLTKGLLKTSGSTAAFFSPLFGRWLLQL